MGVVSVKAFDVAAASEADLHGYYEVSVESHAVDLPNEPRMSFDEFVGKLKNPPTGVGALEHWLVRRDGLVVAAVTVAFPEEENAHIALTTVTVHPRLRRQGIGTSALRALLPELMGRGRGVVEAWQLLKGGAGERWALEIGFQPAKSMELQALVFAQTDSARWKAKAPAGYRLERWVGAAPDHLVSSYAAAHAAMDDAPIGDSDFKSVQWSAARVREIEADLRSREIERRVVVAVHEQTGEVVGLTEIELYPNRPAVAMQGDTAVVADHRGHGIGLWIKAHMVCWLIEERPVLQRVHTGTHTENTHMLKVNEQLGFETLRSVVAVNRPAAELTACLADRRATDFRA
ncbi:Acetyltransferase (GNAT) domain-containing protein [Lentzea waywayandensis]|uniref:Acetyltransferase (GNAT) domain-containing protein n=1 Tax=Lentzea waywayandensis TaxID=84724 RepID=A0A1I6EX11_9PSEU|nr:GNAT family N-acetyltransferase [Lentzea waywayandensis]SFR22204.1 Acetyltransferase (GNAT) domain-containing protein [Lentzea waywayandensis]